MDLSAALALRLRELVAGVGMDDDSVSEALGALVADLRRTVSCYHGLRLTLVPGGWPITLTAFSYVDGARPATSLRLALSILGDGLEPGSQLVLYAGTPGALVDLAADLEYLYPPIRGPGPPGRSVDSGQPEAWEGPGPVLLDIDLPPVSLVSGVTGLAEFATINRAIGWLIERGHADDARDVLHRGARTDGLPVHLYAKRLLEEYAPSGGLS